MMVNATGLAHNPKVVGSNPTPATKIKRPTGFDSGGPFYFGQQGVDLPQACF